MRSILRLHDERRVKPCNALVRDDTTYMSTDSPLLHPAGVTLTYLLELIITSLHMADTIVNTPATQDSGAAGWVVALVIVVAVIAAGVFFYQRGSFGAAPTGGTNINVTVPNPVAPAPTTP